MKCLWCEAEGAVEAHADCPWVMPDGRSAVRVKEVPSFHCPNCGITYQDDDIIEKVEKNLLLADLSGLSQEFTYEQLINAPSKQNVRLFG